MRFAALLGGRGQGAGDKTAEKDAEWPKNCVSRETMRVNGVLLWAEGDKSAFRDVFGEKNGVGRGWIFCKRRFFQ